MEMATYDLGFLHHPCHRNLCCMPLDDRQFSLPTRATESATSLGQHLHLLFGLHMDFDFPRLGSTNKCG